MKNIVLIILLSLCVNTLIAKNHEPIEKISIIGKVIDKETQQPLEYATIVIKSLKDEIITGGITDINGLFDVRVPRGFYNISIEYISFKTFTILNQEIKQTTDLGVISLEMDAQALSEVEIIAEKSTVEIRLDKKIYNVGKDMTVKGGSASDVLDNVPSVTVDVEGNVSLRGNENVRILVNGKPSGLVGLSGTDALRQLPADAIEKVEVITSPSARYDAEGTAGILNIILRKGKAQGFNGSLSANAGDPDNFGASINLNYRTNKANFFNSTGYNYRNAPGNSSNSTTYFNENGSISSFRNEKTTYERENNRFNTRFGVEYLLTDKSSLTGTVLYRKSDGEDIATNINNQLDANNNLNRTYQRVEEEDEVDETIEYSLNFTQDFKTDGHKLIFDFQYGKSTENSNAFISDFDTFPNFLENNPERNNTDEESKDILIKADYVLPIGENAQFEFGFKADLNELTTDYLVEDFDENTNQFFNNTNFSNTLNFEQDVYAIYSQYGKKINKFSYLLGLRAETTDRKINLEQTNESYDKNFTEFFPTVNLGLEFNDSESLTLGYSKRLRRPRSWFLNPFESRTSETYIRKGNVNLDPTYTSSFDLGYLKRWDKFTLNSSIYYQHAINNIDWVQTEDVRDIDGVPTLVIIRNPINLSSQDRYGFEFTTNYNPFKWWRLNNSFNFFKSVTDGEFNNISYDSDDVSWFTRMVSRVTLPGEIDWQTTGFYMGPSEGAQSKRDGMLMVNLAFSKDIFKENATVSLNVSDLFNTRKRKSTSYSPTTESVGEFQWRERQIMLNFTYRFNQKKKRERSQSGYDGGGEEEMFKA
ncbi:MULTISPECIES: TonB-dependent receptor domain-containing protein [Flavobacteriaceae]|uniref:TonB-dependent receptor n=2 Tax=Flavobacteriaceae TaxID=49546 RepID=A0A4Y8AVY8_9FLAO|nr:MULTISPECIES: TonB-dependent receptor [Flavobacteriaceae]TEW76670.1 TonB-dependent receptor [Gramella jeungdoensis]GGK50994.1 TonB-dependent receptor [Lutibacter litoralis]